MESIDYKKGRIQDHFDSIASQYSEELPIFYQKYLLKRKMEFILKQCDNLKEKIGLDIGCGQGIYAQYLNQHAKKVVGIDFSYNNVKNTLNDNNKYALNSDGTNLPFKSNNFDFCYSINVLHHLPSRDMQKRFIDEMIRVVKPGGMLFFFDLSQKNPLFAFYLNYIFPIIRSIDEGDELFYNEKDIVKLTKNKARLIDVDFYSFVPDIASKGLLNIISRIERVIEKTFLKRLAMHQVIILQKKIKENDK